MYYFYQIYQWLSDVAMKTSGTCLLNINLERRSIWNASLNYANIDLVVKKLVQLTVFII